MAIVGVFLVALFFYSLLSKRLEKTIITGPMVFAFIGILTFLSIPQISDMEINNEAILMFGEIALVLVLFSDSSRISFRQVIKERDLPSRLLVIGLPLTIILGAVIATVMFTELSVWEAAILATILAPTDASLGDAVVHSRLVPQAIREAINVESGLNDGLSTPFLMLFISLAFGEAITFEHSWMVYFLKQIGFGILIGFIIGWGGGKLLTIVEKRDWVDENARFLGILALAILSWGIADHIFGGNGFVAAFVAGGSFQTAYEEVNKHKEGTFQAFWGQLLVYFVFYLFGIIATPALPLIPIKMWVYAVMSLTIIRMLPVWISMIGAKLQTYTTLFIGWFGPRGLASVVLGLIYLDNLEKSTAGREISFMIIATVLLSIIAHGITANPGTKWYAEKLKSLDSSAPEFATRDH